MTAGELIKYLEDWAPPGVSWERDNTGLQIGSSELKIKNILLCLELNQKVLTEAVEKRCNFVFTHHPLIFTPIRKLDFQNSSQAKLIESIIKNNITVYSAHTNLDYAKDGVSFELAKTLKLKRIKFLEPQEGNQFKVVVFVPQDHLDNLAKEIFLAGGGIIGEYRNCSFRVNGEGTFLGSENSNPSIGKKQQFEKVEETRLEFLVDAWKLDKVIAALIKAHPYEEPAYDIIPLKNKNVNYGAGAIGELEKDFTEKEFLEYAGSILKTGALRFSSGKKKTVRKVAVCGGAGSEYIDKAISSGADAFITADIKYHSFQDAFEKILLIDAGHYETEIFSLNAVKRKIEKRIDAKQKIKVFKYSGNTNPVQFYKH
jgi:dinuclear metal center YbgI/SA1388 family protein